MPNDLAIMADGRIFLKQEFLPTRKPHVKFKISTMLSPRLKSQIREGQFPFFVETMVFWNPHGDWEPINFGIYEKNRDEPLMQHGERRYEVDNILNAMKVHNKVTSALKLMSYNIARKVKLLPKRPKSLKRGKHVK